MKVKGRALKYVGHVLREKNIDWKNIREKLPEEYKKLLPPDPENIENEKIFSLEIYLELLAHICEKENIEFARFIGKRSAEIFFSTEMKIAQRIKDIEWLISKDFLIGESFFAGGKYHTEKLSENEIKVKFENLTETNEFIEEKIKGFIEGTFEMAGIKAQVLTLLSPLKEGDSLEVLIKW